MESWRVRCLRPRRDTGRVSFRGRVETRDMVLTRWDWTAARWCQGILVWMVKMRAESASKNRSTIIVVKVEGRESWPKYKAFPQQWDTLTIKKIICPKI